MEIITKIHQNELDKKSHEENKERVFKDIYNGHREDCLGYEDPYSGVDCNCFDGIEDYEVEVGE